MGKAMTPTDRLEAYADGCRASTARVVDPGSENERGGLAESQPRHAGGAGLEDGCPPVMCYCLARGQAGLTPVAGWPAVSFA